MELFKLTLIGIAYLFSTLYCGRYLIKLLGLKFKSEILNFLLGFFIIEAVSYISFVLFGIVSLKSFWYSFLPNILLILVILIRLGFYKDNFRLNFTFCNGFFWPCFFLFCCISGMYLIDAKDQLISILNLEGVIYQDVIYHGGIVNSIINFGYPVQDPQFYNQELNYHLFTHFLAAKITYLAGTSALLAYQIFLNFVGILFYSIISIAVSYFLIQWAHLSEKLIPLYIFTLSFAAFFCTFLVGGLLNVTFIFNYFFSASFQWQLVILLIFYFVIMEMVHFNNYSTKNLIVLLGLLFVASITKISSLPLMVAGILSLSIYYVLFFNKVLLKYWSKLGVFYIIGGVLIFILFFSGNKSESSILEFNLDFVERIALVQYLKLSAPLILILIYLITTLSYRFLLMFDLKNYNTWFSGAILLAGFVLSLLVKENQVYFLLPALIISSHFSLSILWNAGIRKYLLLLTLPLIIFSFYPIANFDLSPKDILGSRDHFYPINNDRVKLYNWININTDKNEIIFTTSLLGSTENRGDNFYPAALSERIFYIGGYRFGGVENNPEFEDRIQIVRNFSVNKRSIWDILKKEKINYILIERNGNVNDSIFNKIENFNSNQFYKTVYKNNYGVVLKVIK